MGTEEEIVPLKGKDCLLKITSLEMIILLFERSKHL
jgi:hypothetical protein